MNNISNLNSDLNLTSNNSFVFIDSNVDNYQSFLDSANNNAEVIILNSTENGIEQITKTLANYSEVESIQIISHGQVGTLELGSAQINNSNLNNYAADLTVWSKSLAEHGDILLLGCNVAMGVAGIDFVTNLSQLTSADVAASSNLTGNSQLGGDWKLEVTTGEIEANIAISAGARNNYDSVLASYNGKEYQLTSTSLSWEQAQAEAVSLGGNLVTINDAAEETWLQQTFGTTERFWIGLTDRNQEGDFQWANGENTGYRNWAAGEPNDYKFNGNFTAGEDYVQMNFSRTRQWNDMPNSYAGTFRGIIELDNSDLSSDPKDNQYRYIRFLANSEVNGSPWTSIAELNVLDANGNTISQADWNLVSVNSEETVAEFAPATYAFDGNNNTFWHTQWAAPGNANDPAHDHEIVIDLGNTYQLSGFNYLPRQNSPNGRVENYQFFAADQASNWGNAITSGSFSNTSAQQTVLFQNTPQNSGVIGLETNTYEVNEADATAKVTILRNQGSDGAVTVDYRTVNAAATSGSDYTAVTGTATFADGEISKTITIPIIDDNSAEGTEDFSFTIDNVTGGATLLAPRTALVNIIDNDSPNTLTYNGNQYLLTDSRLTWSEAQAQATNLGGNLVTINDAAEEAWLQGNFGVTEGFWLGINDRAREGTFEWVSGQAVTYTNWAPGEPNNGGGNQDFGWMNFSSSRQWDDNSSNALFRGIIEIGGSNPSDNQGTDNGLNSEDTPAPILNNETVVSGLNQPTAIEWTPNGDRFFIAEKGGVIKLSQNGQVNNTPFIDLTAQVNGTRDRGLLDIAVHPDFFNGSPYVYALYTYDPPEVFQNTGLAGPDGSGNRASRLTRITADASTNFTTAIPGSEVVILGTNSTWNNFNAFANSTNDFNEAPAGILPDGTNLQDFLAADSESHAIGSVEFGPDGALYVSNGDGTSYNRVDPRTVRVQDIDNLSGKIIRIDPITGDGLADNPFYNGDSNANRSKVYQLGLRNPFRMTIDPRNGDVFVGDVGWTQWEEINSAGAGANFGWPYYEGGNEASLRTGGYQDLTEAQAFYNSGQSAESSVLALNHRTNGINAIVLGDIYTGNAFPQEYQGDLFFSDLGRGIVYNASFDDQGNVTGFDTFTTGANIVVQIIQAPDGSLYYVDLDDGIIGRWFFSPPRSNSPIL